MRSSSIFRQSIIKLNRPRVAQFGSQSECFLETADNLLSTVLEHGYAPIVHDLFPSERLFALSELSRKLFTDIIPKLSDVEREKLRTSDEFRGLYHFYPLTGKGGRPPPIECFSFGKELSDPSTLRSAYFQEAGYEKDEYYSRIKRKNPIDSFNTLVPEGMRAAEELTKAFDDLQVVSMDILCYLAASLGIKPSQDIVRPSPEAAVDENYFAPYHDKSDSNMVLRMHRAVVERASLVDVTIKPGQSQGSAISAPRVLRRKTALVERASVQASDSSSSSTNSEGRHDLPTPEKDSTTISLLIPDMAAAKKLSTSFSHPKSSGKHVIDSVKSGFDLYNAEELTRFAIKFPLEVNSPDLHNSTISVPIILTIGSLFEYWTDGAVAAARYREQLSTESADPSQEAADRCNIVFQCIPNWEATINPLTLSEEYDPNAVEGQPAVVGDLLSRKL